MGVGYKWEFFSLVPARTNAASPGGANVAD